MNFPNLRGIAVAAPLFLGIASGPARAGGVTVIAHGFNSDIESWIIPMAEEMPGYAGFPGSEAGCYRLKVSSTSSPAVLTKLAGVEPTISDSGEILIKLDWSAIDGLFQATSTQVALLAVNALTNSMLNADTGGRPLVELPMHLIGHSRGSSVVSEMARLLGQQGIWVDQVTTLDPVPLLPLGDSAVRTWENVLYADNYWQALSGESITGSSLAGAFNRRLTNLSGGYGSGHSDVHLWYHGTIDLTTPATDTQATIGPSERTAWWTAGENGGAATGYLFSRIGGGDRLSSAAPAGGDQVRAGFNGAWDLGGGLVANRQSLSSNGGLWPNVIRCQRGGSGSIAAGGTFPLAIHYQAGATASGDVALTVLLDPDANPWNDNAFEIDAGALAKTGTDAVGFVEIPVATGSTPPGSYRVAARLADGINERVLYAGALLEITAAQPAPSIQRETVRIEGGLMRFTVLGTPGQVVEIQAATDLVDWEEIATHTLTSASWEFSDPDTADYPARFYQVVEGP